MTPLPSASRLAMATDQIRKYIRDQGLRPGDRLASEEWFASELQVGRPVVREAFKGLEALGIVESQQGVGRFVRAFEPRNYLREVAIGGLLGIIDERELMESRCLLEIATIASAVPNLTADDHAELRRLLECMRARLSTRSIPTEEDFALHRLISSRGPNRLIIAMIDALDALAAQRPAPEISASDALSARRQDLREHEAIVDAVIAGDGARARDVLMAHFDTTAERLSFTPVWRFFGPSGVPAPAPAGVGRPGPSRASADAEERG